MNKIKNCEIVGFGNLKIENIIFDYNGTIACNGIVSEEVLNELINLSQIYNVWVLTADTYGTVTEGMKDTGVSVKILVTDNGTVEKNDFLLELGVSSTIAIGNGSNDSEMLKNSKVGICVIGREGASVKALSSADVIVNSIGDAINLIKNPKALIATLRE